MLSHYLKIWPHYVIPQFGLSRLAGWLASSQCKPWKNGLIKWFIHQYQVDMSTAEISDYRKFSSFNDFFIRKLRPDARPIVQQKHAIVCPVDGIISQFGHIENSTLVQAKGKSYTLSSLLAAKQNLVQQFEDGYYATLYLAPHNYHRIHMPLDGICEKMIYVPGKLFSVNQSSALVVDKLFARNERVICLFKTNYGPMAVILIGAMVVASINTKWHGDVTPPRLKQIYEWSYDKDNIISLKAGEELGYFKLGSSVILLFPKDSLAWEQSLRANDEIQFGQYLGTMHG
jgi:phosphatidylserine decarboxylase